MTRASDLDALVIDTIRALSMDAVQAANSGHPGTPMALAPLGWALFDRLRKHDPAAPDWADRDRFILSCGHASMLHYALLHLGGYDLGLDEIKQFRQWGSRTPGHPENFITPGVESTTGPLGQGISMAVGMAMAERHLAARFNRPGFELFDHRTWVIASDGDVMEGVSAEAASLAGHLGLGKLIVFWDDNSITIDGRTDIAFTEDVCARYAAYGWEVLTVADGNDLEALEAAGRAAMASDKPTFIQVKTIIGWPSPGKQDTSAAHGAPLGEDEIRATREVMGWPQEAFHVPAEVAQAQARARARGAAAHQPWEALREQYAAAHPALAAELERTLAGTLPEGLFEGVPAFPADAKGLATRKASGAVLSALAPGLPELIGGSADLAGSNLTYLKGEADFTPGQAGGGVPRNVHWGIREHAMAAAQNGMALHGGVIPYGATFLVFSDYMRPAIRLACLMGLKARYVFTHDSIGLGEDGPTHQPVEHLAALRSMMGLLVLRPGDAEETRVCWEAALRHEGPAALVLTRQNLPTLDRSRYAPAEGAAKGAYVVSEAEGEAQLTLIATGSELTLALGAQDALKAEGVAARVVSMPSWELFAAQPPEYQAAVLPQDASPRVVIEAGLRFGWERWAGPNAAYVTMETFGASAPAEVLFEKFGFSVEAVVEKAKGLLG